MLPKHLEAKKRHHYVWAEYLTRWGNGTKNVFYTTKTGKIAWDSVRAIVADDYFYKTTTLTDRHVEIIKGFSRPGNSRLHQQNMSFLDDFLRIQQAEALYLKSGIKNSEIELSLHVMSCNALENLHAAHERSASPVLTELAGENLDVLQDQQRMIQFMMFLGHQISRTKTWRDSLIKVLFRRTPLEIEVADAMEHAWWFLSYMYGTKLGFSLYTDRHNARHALLINDTTVPFITSDQPIVNVHSCVSETEFGAPEHADFYYPISPRIAYIVCDSKRFASGKSQVDEATVLEFNSKVAAQAMRHIIGDTEEVIRFFKSHIGRRYRKVSVDRAVPT
ncbi:DUF4238 domain-containing protein [Herbaspirillum sp. RV1423]|uniref:DUF4238 domain-containing protein n=1 Tax=Herbaspirillum sp. RV1423 TaxID=1443993 RepID=UPI0004B0AFB7|nr:DUF4238 domain-containing protein [Herbaspirillum sp. RV1423]